MANNLKNNPCYKQAELDFRLGISRRIACICIIFITPFLFYYSINKEYTVAALLAFMILFFVVKYFRSRSEKSDPVSTFIILIVLMSVVFSIISLTYGRIAFLWAYPILFMFYFMLSEKLAWIANIIFLGLAFYLAWKVEDPDVFIRICVTLTICSIFLVSIIGVITRQHNLLQKQAIIDPLTNVYNRTILEDQLEKYIEQSKRNHLPISIATIDIDHFKVINDQYGHDRGDTVLKHVAELITSRMRDSDNVFRIGGEEFLVFLYNSNIKDAQVFAESVRETIASTSIIEGHPITASIGLAQYSGRESLRQWIKRSDEHLYKAKESGRNRVVY